MLPLKRFSSVTGEAKYELRFGPLPWEQHHDIFRREGDIFSVSHPWRGAASKSGDVGGPFFLDYHDTRVTSQEVNFEGLAGYRGDIYPVGVYRTSIEEFTIAPMGDSELLGLGSTYMSRVLPTNPSANLAQFLGELKGGAPHALGASFTKANVGRFKAAGDEYLNVEFGWKPFVSDLKGFANAINNSDRIIESYRKGSDKKIHRRYTAPAIRETRFDNQAYITMPDQSAYFSARGTHSSTLEKSTWFEGAFRYHVPVGDSQLARLARLRSYASKVLGLNLNPELAWELAPWSWFADWFGNTGDIIHNISYLGQDGLAMQYGYVMCHQSVTNRAIASRFNSRDDDLSAMTVWTHDIKQRLPATPYGFSFDIPEFTNTQVAVMAALGLSRSGTPWSHV